MKIRLLTADEVEDFWAMNVSIEAAYVSDDELTRALEEGRVQRGSVLGARHEPEAFWHRAPVDLDHAVVRATCIVVPPGQLAAEIPFLDRPGPQDTNILWDPFLRGQEIRLAGAIPDAQVPVAMAECARIAAALDTHW